MFISDHPQSPARRGGIPYDILHLGDGRHDIQQLNGMPGGIVLAIDSLHGIAKHLIVIGDHREIGLVAYEGLSRTSGGYSPPAPYIIWIVILSSPHLSITRLR